METKPWQMFEQKSGICLDPCRVMGCWLEQRVKGKGQNSRLVGSCPEIPQNDKKAMGHSIEKVGFVKKS